VLGRGCATSSGDSNRFHFVFKTATQGWWLADYIGGCRGKSFHAKRVDLVK
jgi:hypothetical protein